MVTSLVPRSARESARRFAFALYAVLLVLPTLVLGFLQWHHIWREHRAELEEIPHRAEDAALRFRKTLQGSLDKLIESERSRPFEHYARYYSPDSPAGEFTLLESPLSTIERPRGILGWFRLDLTDPEARGVDVFQGALGDVQERTELESAAHDLTRRYFESQWMRSTMPVTPAAEELELPMRVLAASAARADDVACLEAEQMSILEPVQTLMGNFQLVFYREDDGVPRLVAYRHVLVEPLPELVGRGECLQRLATGRSFVQGFFLEPRWFFEELPTTVSSAVLARRERFLRDGDELPGGGREYLAQVSPVRDLGFDTGSPADEHYGSIRIAIDTADIDARYRERTWRFLGVATMLGLALATGVLLLSHSVRKDIEQAERTENFVAAVTHELRTPLSTIQLHAEMLQDGWVRDEKQRDEYHRRIVRETARLSTLVERVLEKAKLGAGAPTPRPLDLSAEVTRHSEKLLGWRTTPQPDLTFELPADLPEALATPEAVGSILVNLVENARKYAPVDPSKPKAEPIRIVVHRERGGLALDVQDRGPGVPASERERIFEAFYRTGSEQTRSVRGTGLGLHLVTLHASSCGGRAEVLARDGGGAIFRVVFPLAPAQDA